MTTADRPLSWRPSFMYNGHRYLELDGLPEPLSLKAVRGQVIAAATESAGAFECSDQRLNDLHRIIRRSVTSNMFSMFTDCPQREKLGYLEQLHLVFDTLHWNYDVQSLLINTLRIIGEAQGPDGHLGLYVPEWDPFPDPWRGDANFGLAAVFLPWQLYRAYGDVQVLADHYRTAARYARHLLDVRSEGLIRYGLGDWNGREPRYVPMVATATLASACDVLARMAATIDHEITPDPWATRAAELRSTLVDHFVGRDGTVGTVGTGSVAETAIALKHRIVPEHLIIPAQKRLIGLIVADDFALDVGEMAMAALLSVLAEAGRHDLIYTIATQDRHPGYGYQLRHGATALTETWDGPTFGYSQNHFMNGAVDHWFFGHLAGISQSEDSMGYRTLTIKPRPAGGVTWVRASHQTPAGEVSIHWQVAGSMLALRVVTPAGVPTMIEWPDGTQQFTSGGPLVLEHPLLDDSSTSTLG